MRIWSWSRDKLIRLISEGEFGNLVLSSVRGCAWLQFNSMSNPSDYLSSLYSLSGKVAVVIGGTGELCGAMAEGMAGAGAEVVLVGRNEEKAKPRLR